MKYAPLVVSFMLLFLATASLMAQKDSAAVNDEPSQKNLEVFITGGISRPYLPTEFSDNWKSGWNAGGGIGYSFSPGSLGYGAVYLTFGYDRFPFNTTGVRSRLTQQNIAVSGTPSSALNIMLNLKGSFSPTKQSIAPYFLFGVGFLSSTPGNVDVTGDTTFTLSSDSRGAFAWSAGVGIEAPITEKIGIFAQAQSILGVMERSRQHFPFSAGIRYRFSNQ